MVDADFQILHSKSNNYTLKGKVLSTDDYVVYRAIDQLCKDCFVKVLLNADGETGGERTNEAAKEVQLDNTPVDSFVSDGQICLVYGRSELQEEGDDYFNYSTEEPVVNRPNSIAERKCVEGETGVVQGEVTVGNPSESDFLTGIENHTGHPSGDMSRSPLEISASGEHNTTSSCGNTATAKKNQGCSENGVEDKLDGYQVGCEKVNYYKGLQDEDEIGPKMLMSAVNPHARIVTWDKPSATDKSLSENLNGILIRRNEPNDTISKLPRTPFPKAVPLPVGMSEQANRNYYCSDPSSEYHNEDEDYKGRDANYDDENKSITSDDLSDQDDDEDDEDDEDADADDDEDDDDEDVNHDDSQPNFLSPCVFLNEYPQKRPREESFIPMHTVHPVSEYDFLSTNSIVKGKKFMPRTPMPHSVTGRKLNISPTGNKGTSSSGTLCFESRSSLVAVSDHSVADFEDSITAPNCSMEFELKLTGSKMLNRRKSKNGPATDSP